MPTLAEILAAKKNGATATPIATPAPTSAPPTSFAKVKADPEVAAIVQAKDPVVGQHPDTGLDVRQSEASSEVKTIAEPTKEEPAAAPVPKAMSFAEKMALKKAEASSHSTSAAPAVSIPASVEANSPKPSATTAPAPVVAQSLAQVAPTPVPADTTTISTEDVSDEARQAYTDIKEKIDTLNTMSGDDLKNAMSTLKKSLMANPAAVSLMEDTDIGQMVIALRKLTGEDIAEAAKEKTPGRKKKDKQIDLSDAAVVAAVFDEL